MKQTPAPLLVALAGPNGAGKTTFHHSHLKPLGLRFVNADVLAAELGLGAYEAAALADVVRRELLRRRESFVFETVFSDPSGGKLAFLKEAVEAGYEVVLCFIGLASAALSEQRVALRVSQGGHDVPDAKLRSRFPRTLRNLKAALPVCSQVRIYDNSDLRHPYRELVVLERGRVIRRSTPLPPWLKPLLG